MTKAKAKAKLKKILEKGDALKELVNNLRVEAEKTLGEIEPREGKDGLTNNQEERYGWFEELKNRLQDSSDSIDDYIKSLEILLF